MEYRNFGRPGVKVSPLCLGCMNFGGKTSKEDTDRIIDRAIDAGIIFLDTANIYNQGKKALKISSIRSLPAFGAPVLMRAQGTCRNSAKRLLLVFNHRLGIKKGSLYGNLGNLLPKLA